MSVDKYPSIFSRQMEAIVYIYLNFNTVAKPFKMFALLTFLVVPVGLYTSRSIRVAKRHGIAWYSLLFTTYYRGFSGSMKPHNIDIQQKISTT